jgi:CheY-like chemotaxis protein
MDLSPKHCVLVVDDDASIRRLLMVTLRRQGYRTLEACNGREALVSMRAESPDIVIMDLVMPEVSGWEVLRERAADPSLLRIPMIIVTASHTRKAHGDVLEQVCAVIAKPFDLDVVLTTLKDRLENPGVLAPAAA